MHLDNCDYFLSQLRTVVMTALILSFFVTGELHRYRYSCSGNVDDNGYGNDIGYAKVNIIGCMVALRLHATVTQRSCYKTKEFLYL
jgi:hypothetical protein